jgi:DNA-binding MarR family transcriptional regulator
MERGAVEELEEAQRETRTELLRIAQEDPNLLDEAERLEQVMSLADENMEHVLDEFLEKGDLTTGALVYFTDLSRPTVTKRLDRLHAAEQVEYLHEPTALWRLVEDPR